MGEIKKNQVQSESLNELNLVRNRLDLLELENAEKRKPWYKNASIIISFSALLLSFIINIRGIVEENISDTIAKRTESLQTLITLINTQEDEKSKDSILKDDGPDKDDALNAIHSKEEILLSRLDAINKDIPDKLSFREYLYIGKSNQDQGDIYKPPFYWTSALKAATNIFDSVEVYEYFIDYYFIVSSIRDTVKGKNYISMCINTLKRKSGYNFKEMLSSLYSNCADNYDFVNDTSKVIYYLGKSAEVIKSIPKRDDHYKEAIDEYNNVINELVTESDNKYYLDSLRY